MPHADVIRPRERRDDLHPLAAADHAVVRRTAGDGQIEPIVVQQRQVAKPAESFRIRNHSASEFEQPLAEQRRLEHAAVEQHHIRPRRVCSA